MSISYSPGSGWRISPLRTNYSETYTPLRTDNNTSRPTDLPTSALGNPVWISWKASNGSINSTSTDLSKQIRGLYARYLGRTPSPSEVNGWVNTAKSIGWGKDTTSNFRAFNTIERDFIHSAEYQQKLASYEINKQKNEDNRRLNDEARRINEKNATANATLAKTAEENRQTNKTNSAINSFYNNVLRISSSTRGGDYVPRRDSISAQSLINAGVPSNIANEIVENAKAQFKTFYKAERLQTWDSKLGVQPPYAEYQIKELGVKPNAVTGVFDPSFYKNQNPQLEQAWNAAVANDDLDITERYGEANFYWQHYTNVGRHQGLRGNEAEATAQANSYTEEGPTDLELQDIRDLQLGVDSDTVTNRLLNISEVNNEWTKARQGDPYWKNLAKEKFLDVDKPEEFAALFRLSERDEDKQIILEYNVNSGSGITELEQALSDVAGARAEVDVKKFAALNQTILRDTISELKKVRAQQEQLSFYRGFQGFNEIFNLNNELANSILGDSGVGGVLSFTSAGKAEEDLLGALKNVTGVRSNVAYNWQQWFNKEIKDKYGLDYAVFEPLEEKKDIINAYKKLGGEGTIYDSEKESFSKRFIEEAGFETSEELQTFLEGQGEEGAKILDTLKTKKGEEADLTLIPILSRIEADIKTLDEQKDRSLALTLSAGDLTEAINVEAQFARDYIDEYLIPRFDTSRSMDEFVEYIDVRQEEKNPFQTQDTYDAIQLLAEQYSKRYLDDIKLEAPRSFDADFYFDPISDASNEALYQKQRETVQSDWEKAKAGDPFWQAQAYRFGVDVNNKAAFARMHFEVRGQGQGFDPAEDITNAAKIKSYIYDTVVPVLKEEALKGDPVFGQFIKPEEFADELLQGLDPNETPEEWKEILQRYGLENFAGDVEELKEFIIETLRTGSAQQIREEIKFLNERRQKPTQEILGVTYIERPEDYKDELAKPTTELFSVFQQAGYQGTEDEFYENFFPDLDRSEQITLTKAGRDERLKTFGLDLEDPFASLGTIESFFPEDQEEEERDRTTSNRDFSSSYFRLGEDEDEDEVDYKSNAGKQFLGEFTSLFKGLS